VLPGAVFETVEVPGLEEGDLVALFTDGVVESIDDDACFGHQGALENLRLHRHEPAAEIVQHVCEAARAFMRGRQDDDMTMLVCKVGPPSLDQGTPGF
jgi:serine phosphatase RsbU (regulator of sigma subunit)